MEMIKSPIQINIFEAANEAEMEKAKMTTENVGIRVAAKVATKEVYNNSVIENKKANETMTEWEREDLARANIKLVYFVANSFRSTGVDIEELTSVGMLGYAKSINTYKSDKKTKFSTYAIQCIKNEILYFLRKENTHRKKTTSMNTVLSTDKNGKDFEMGDIIEDNEIQVGDVLLETERRDMILKAISRLTAKEQYIVLYRYGILDGVKKTQKTISKEIQMSQANVSKLQKTSVVKLKRYLKELTGDMDFSLEKALEL